MASTGLQRAVDFFFQGRDEAGCPLLSSVTVKLASMD